MTQPSPTHIRRESVLDSEKTHKTRPKDDYDDECQISSTEKLHQKVTSSKHNKENEGAVEKRSNSPQNSDDSMKRVDKNSAKHDDDDSKTSTTTSEAGDDKQQLSPGSSHDESSSPKDHVTSTQTSNKICVVCGDKALSCNFGAITCESCKAFFRRNAFKDFSAKCDKTCDVTVETRSYCKKCRQQKCLDMGMKVNLILSDDQKRKRKQKIYENKMKRIVQQQGDTVLLPNGVPPEHLHMFMSPDKMAGAAPPGFMPLPVYPGPGAPPPTHSQQPAMTPRSVSDVVPVVTSAPPLYAPLPGMTSMHQSSLPPNSHAVPQAVPHAVPQQHQLPPLVPILTSKTASLSGVKDETVNRQQVLESGARYSPPHHAPPTTAAAAYYASAPHMVGPNAVAPQTVMTLQDQQRHLAVGIPEYDAPRMKTSPQPEITLSPHQMTSQKNMAVAPQHLTAAVGAAPYDDDQAIIASRRSSDDVFLTSPQDVTGAAYSSRERSRTVPARDDVQPASRHDEQHQQQSFMAEPAARYYSGKNMNTSAVAPQEDDYRYSLQPQYGHPPDKYDAFVKQQIMQSTQQQHEQLQQQQPGTLSAKDSVDVMHIAMPANTVVNQSAQTNIGQGYAAVEADRSQQQQQQQYKLSGDPLAGVTSQSRGAAKRSFGQSNTDSKMMSYRSPPGVSSSGSDHASSIDGSLSPYTSSSSSGDAGIDVHHQPAPPPAAPEQMLKKQSSADISHGGLLSTTLKVIQDVKLFQTKISDLPPPVPKPLFTSAFNDPVLSAGLPSFRSVAADLRNACLLAYDKLPEKACPSDPSYVQMFNFGEDTIRQLVVLAKNLPPFQALCRDDQICLLKASVLHMMVLKSAMSYDPERRGWRVRDENGDRDVIPDTVRGNQDGRVLMNHYGIIVISVLVSSGRDLIVIILLIVLSLLSDCNLKEPNELQDRDKVQAAHNVYLEFLHEYVTLKYPHKTDMFEDLMKNLDIVRDFSDTYINAMLKSPLSELNPLLLEINDVA